jgi:LysR family glycine cleavage system transcriptional activator
MNKRKRLPSLKALRTFQVAGKYLSFKDAADELFITASAVSHQVKGLEEYLGMELMTRKTRSLVFTSAGKKYFEFLDEMFERLESETHQLWAEHGRKMVRLNVPSFFASELLLPKLNALNALIPDIDIRLNTLPSAMAEHSSEADLSILLGADDWPNLTTHRLFAGHLVVAASPSLMKEFDSKSYKSLDGQTLIVHESRPDGWVDWAKDIGIETPTAGKILRFDSMTSVMQALSRGLGFGIVYWPLSDSYFHSGSIVRVFEAYPETNEDFYLAFRPEDGKRPEIITIIDWLRQEFQNDR